jgi:hypothetical protein
MQLVRLVGQYGFDFLRSVLVPFNYVDNPLESNLNVLFGRGS